MIQQNENDGVNNFSSPKRICPSFGKGNEMCIFMKYNV